MVRIGSGEKREGAESLKTRRLSYKDVNHIKLCMEKRKKIEERRERGRGEQRERIKSTAIDIL